MNEPVNQTSAAKRRCHTHRPGQHQHLVCPPLPDNEPLRLQRLEALGILDAWPMDGYQGLCRLAAAICRAPVSAITLIGQDRQHTKATHGAELLNMDPVTGFDVDRDIAFCAHAIVDPAHVLVIPDATVDERFQGNPLVTGKPGIRFYAGAPIVSIDGFALGALCVIDNQPRQLEASQVAAMSELAKLVAAQFEHERLARQHRQLKVKAIKQENEQRLSALVDMLNRKNKEQQRFIQMLAHDFRAPLNTVNSFSALLSEENTQDSPEDRKSFLDFIVRGGRRMKTLLDDLLSFVLAESANIHTQAVDMVELMKQLREDLQSVLQRSGGRLEFGSLPTVHGDANLLRLALQNLITNGLKFQATAAVPVIAVHIDRVDNAVQIRVTDNGIGIGLPTDRLNEVFEDFARLHSKQIYEGSGLGLPTVRRIAQLHQGDVCVESTSPAGTTFLIRIPQPSLATP